MAAATATSLPPAMRLHFTHFRTRLLVLLLIPLLGVLAAVYLAVERTNTANAQALIQRDLAVGVANFNASIGERNENLAIAGDALSGDFAFRQAWNTDRLTLLSAMDNLLGRLVTADFIAMVDADSGLLRADSRRPELTAVEPEWQALIAAAVALDRQGEYPEADGVQVLDGRPYHLTLLPFLTPDLTGWVTLGFELGPDFTATFKESISADISVLFHLPDGRWQAGGSTLPEPLPAQLVEVFDPADQDSLTTLGGEDYVTLAQSLSDSGDVKVVLQRSLTAQLAPFRALQQRLFTIFAIGVMVLLAALLLVARNVTRPLQWLTAGARNISTGDYTTRVSISHQDEIGQLATAFNAMAAGLAEKERVRDLLGKVVSPAIANELLQKPPELGGEEREVTVLFTDVRGFTSLCEGRSPQQVLQLLNEYFSVLTTVIEQHGGVVDKYIGDAVMALFGAPAHCDDAAARALQAALAMQTALAQLNAALAARGLAPLTTGIGINSDRVVVGNMGSKSRLNYTAIGDGVNLASRLESLSKRYGSRVVVSDSTRELAPDYLYLPLDTVRVKGKQQPVAIFEPLLPVREAAPELVAAVTAFAEFLRLWRLGDWQSAATQLEHYAELARQQPLLANTLATLYRQRLQQASHQPPADWDGIYSYDS